MDDFKNRLLDFIEQQYGESQRSFERRCGLTQGTIPSIGTKGPSVDVLHKISNNCPELNLDWLVNGKGDMLNASSVIQSIGDHSNHNTQSVGESADLWKKLCEEKDKRIADLERTIQILMRK